MEKLLDDILTYFKVGNAGIDPQPVKMEGMIYQIKEDLTYEKRILS